jgi:transposase
MIRYSKSGSSTNALKRLCQTPFFAHRRKRWNTLFQLPNSLGRSRHGAPARTNQSTASTNNRLSSPWRPLSPSLPGISGSMRRHCAFVSCRRIKIASSVSILNHIRESEGIPHTRFSRWAKSGVWKKVFEILAADADNEYAMIDSTIVRAHQHSAGAQKKTAKTRQSGAAKAD